MITRKIKVLVACISLIALGLVVVGCGEKQKLLVKEIVPTLYGEWQEEKQEKVRMILDENMQYQFKNDGYISSGRYSFDAKQIKLNSMQDNKIIGTVTMDYTLDGNTMDIQIFEEGQPDVEYHFIRNK